MIVDRAKNLDIDIGFNRESVFYVKTRPLNGPVRERIRCAAEDKWQERPVHWKTLVDWIGKGCPEPITGNLAFTGEIDSPEKKAVEFVGPIFERCEQRVRGDRTEWAIRGHDGTKPLVDKRVSVRDLGSGNIHELLRRLACRHLTEDEIVAASTGRNVRLDLSRTTDGWKTEGKPYFVAVRIDPEDVSDGR